jgi:hypothetical protein
MNKKALKYYLIFGLPLVILLLFYITVASIVGENDKIINESKSFIYAIYDNKFNQAFDYLCKSYKDEFFDNPLIFRFSLNNFMRRFGAEPKKEEVDLTDNNVIDKVINIGSLDRKSVYIKRDFPFFPWSRSEKLMTSFASASESDNKYKILMIDFLKLYSDKNYFEFENNKIKLQIEIDQWKVESLILNSENVVNIFKQDSLTSLFEKVSVDEYSLDELKEILMTLKDHNVQKEHITSFCKFILSKISLMNEESVKFIKSLGSEVEQARN